MATTTFFLRKGKRQTAIYVIYRHLDKSKLFSTGIKIDPTQWIESKQKIDLTIGIKPTKQNQSLIDDLKKQSIAFNATIMQLKSKIDNIAERMKLNDLEPLVDDVAMEITGVKKERSSLLSLIDEYIEVSSVSKTGSTLTAIKTGLNTFMDFAKGKNLNLNSFNADLYDKYVNYLFKSGLNNNTVGKKIKILKAFLNFLEIRGHKVNPAFHRYKVMQEQKAIIYLSQKELSQLYKFIFKVKHLTRTRDLFVLQCQTGLRISDLFRLNKEHIFSEYIEMTAMKTKKQIFVPITPIARELLNKYADGLPKIVEQVYNRQIKDCCRIAGLTREIEITDFRAGQKIFKRDALYNHVSSHIAIKTFISHCVERGISPKVVSVITGKTVDVLINHYYGTSKTHILEEMTKAFGTTNMKVS